MVRDPHGGRSDRHLGQTFALDRTYRSTYHRPGNTILITMYIIVFEAIQIQRQVTTFGQHHNRNQATESLSVTSTDGCGSSRQITTDVNQKNQNISPYPAWSPEEWRRIIITDYHLFLLHPIFLFLIARVGFAILTF